MASIQKIPSGRYQLRIKNKVLPKPLFYTFDTLAEAETYKDQVDALLKQGIVPQALMAQAIAKAEKKTSEVENLALTIVVLDYLRTAPVAPSESALLTVMLGELQGYSVPDVTYAWSESYVRMLKGDRRDARGSNGRKVGNLAPGSIRKRVQSLARVLDWHWRRTTPPGQPLPTNPLRTLPNGYSTYSEQDKVAAAKVGLQAKRDVSRDRRVTAQEEDLIFRALGGEIMHGKQRGLEPDPEFQMLVRLVLDTGLRLKEAYGLRVEQINWHASFLNVAGSKGHRGAAKPRTVPMRSSLASALRTFLGDRRTGLVFSFWNGETGSLRSTTTRLTGRFRRLFAYIGAPDITEHDLRHTACCAWFELRGNDGRWIFSDVEICKIMGWSNYSMVLRYASLRGEDLAARLKHF